MSAQRSRKSSSTKSAKTSFKELIKQISRDLAEDRQARERLFKDILALARWKGISIAELFRRAGKSRHIYYKWRREGDVPRRSTLFKLWDALGLTKSDKARRTKKKILLSSEALGLWEALDRAEQVLRETLPSFSFTSELSRFYRLRIGQRIVKLRRERGWNQTELAKATKLSKGLVYGIETARWPADPINVQSYLERIAQALGVTLEDLLR
ncbi:MAG: helix-turn-helix transcriptional regulator [Candidatus Caldarchaeum sp.]